MKACLDSLTKEDGFGELFLLLLLGSLADLGKGSSKYISSEKTSCRKFTEKKLLKMLGFLKQHF